MCVLIFIYRYQFIELYRYQTKLKASFEMFINENSLQDFAALIGVRKTDPYCGKYHIKK